MKKAKKIYTLLGVLVVICVLTIGVASYEEKKEEIKNTDEVILKIAREDVKKISWEYGSKDLSFDMIEGSWKYAKDEAFPVDADKVSTLLDPFEELGAAFIIENVEDLGMYGLDDAECKIVIETESAVHEILLGDFSTMDSQRYVSIGDGNVYLVTEDPMEAYEKTLDDFFLHDEVPDFDQINEIQIAGAGEYTITYEEDSIHTYADDEYFTVVDGNSVPVSEEKITEYINALHSLSLLDYQTYNAVNELEQYGFDEPELEVSIAHEGETEEETFKFSVSKSSTEDEAYLRINESEVIYKITEEEYESLMAVSYNDLRHDKIFTGSFKDITQIDITLEDETYMITSKKEDDETVYYYKEEQIEVDELETSLASMKATEFVDKEPEQKMEISILLSLDNETFPQVKLEFFRYDGESCLALVDEKSVALVAREDVVGLIEAVNAIVLK